MLPLLGALQIFLLRICDVSIGTVRVLFAMRGMRWIASALALAESAIFVTAISRVFKGATDPWKMAGYACGFGAGTFLGITIERWIGSGTILARIVTKPLCAQGVAAALRAHAFGVTVTQGEGREGDVSLLFVVAPRRRTDELLRLTREHDPDAFVTVDTVNHAEGGYVASAKAVSVRK